MCVVAKAAESKQVNLRPILPPMASVLWLIPLTFRLEELAGKLRAGGDRASRDQYYKNFFAVTESVNLANK